MKTISASRCIQMHIVRPAHLNSTMTLFGGQVMSWIDEAAGMSARRHCGKQVVTASVDKLDFLAPAYMDDVITVMAQVIFAGRTSMIVNVVTEVERFSEPGGKTLVNNAFLTMVAVDDNGQPTVVPSLAAEDDEEKALLELGKERRALREKTN